MNPAKEQDLLWALSGDHRMSVPARATVRVAVDPAEAARAIHGERIKLARRRLSENPFDANEARALVASLPGTRRPEAMGRILAGIENNPMVLEAIWEAKDGAPLVGWSPWSSIKKAAKKVGKTVKKAARTVNKIARNKMLKAAVGGVAFVCPAVGVPALAGLAVAAKVTAAARSNNPKKRKAGLATVRRTVALAKTGNRDAKRGLVLLKAANARNRSRAAANAAAKAAKARALAKAKRKVRKLPAWKRAVIAKIEAA